METRVVKTVRVMTVEELIAILEQLPNRAPVELAGRFAPLDDGQTYYMTVAHGYGHTIVERGL